MKSSKSAAPNTPSYDWLTLLQFGGSGLAIGGWLTLVLTVAISALLSPWLGGAEQDSLSLLGAQLGMLAACLLLAPSAYHALRRILGRPSQPFRLLGTKFGYSIFLLPLAMAAAHWALGAGQEWLVYLLYLIPAVLVVAWLAWLALKGLPLGSAQRVWGGLASGLAGVPVIVFALELLAGLLIVILLLVYVLLSPQLSSAVDMLLSAAQNPEPPDISLLTPLLSDPVILFAGFLMLSVIVPIIEELFKPLGVFLLLRRPLSRAQGFALGALGGAGFALAENVFLSAPADTLVLAAAARGGASAMHIITGGLGGYALVRAKQLGRYGGLLAIYALNLLIHGAWNGLVLVTAVAALHVVEDGGLAASALAVISPVLLALLAGLCVFLIWQMNQKLQSNQNA